MLPQNIMAERAVLGSIMVDGETIQQVVDRLTPDDFSQETHREIFSAMQTLYWDDKAIDFLTLTSILRQRGKLNEIGGASKVASLILETPTHMHIDHYAGLVAEASARRRLVSGAGTIAKLAHESDYDRLLREAEAVIETALDGYQREGLVLSPAEWSGLLRENLPALRERQTALPWSCKTLEQVAPKLLPGSLTVVGARTGHGKSFLLLHEAIYHASRGRPVLLATAENTVFQTLIRALSNVVHLDSAALFEGEWEDHADATIQAAVEDMQDWPLYLVGHSGVKNGRKRADRPSRVHPSEIRRAAIRMERDGHSPALIVVDYVQAIAPDERTGAIRTDVIDVLWSLKNLGLEFACPVLTAAQVLREVDKRDRLPRLTDLKESGAIEEVADGVLFLVYWAQYYEVGQIIQESKDRRKCNPNEWMIYEHKDRWGSVSLAAGWLQVQLEYAHIGDLARSYEVEYEQLRTASARPG